jgi:indole-3-glycerol phosphate synthase
MSACLCCIQPAITAPLLALLLQTFKVDLANTKEIMESAAGQEVLRRGLIMAGESGIFTPEHVAYVQSGALGILVAD